MTAPPDPNRAVTTADGVVLGAPRRWLGLEALVLLAGTLIAEATLGEPWWLVPVPLGNWIRVVTCGSMGCQAAREYSLITPPRTGFRWIRSRSRSATVRTRPLSGTRWAMPWCGRAVL